MNINELVFMNINEPVETLGDICLYNFDACSVTVNSSDRLLQT